MIGLAKRGVLDLLGSATCDAPYGIARVSDLPSSAGDDHEETLS